MWVLPVCYSAAMRRHFEMALFITLFGLGVAVIAASPAGSEEQTMNDEIAAAASELEPQLIEARRWFRQHPELSNREVETAAEGWTDYVHTPTFRPDETTIVTGVTAAASLLADFTAADPVD